MKTIKEFALGNDIIVAAHRGSSGTAPENTLAAFTLAIEAGAHMIETDLQFTNDGRIVAFHDLNLMRTTNGSAMPDEFTYEKIRQLDAGSWFHPDFAGERIPLLEEILDLARGKVFLNFEIKVRRAENYSEKIRKLINIVDDRSMSEQIIIGSFDHTLITEVKKEYPLVPTATIKIPGDRRLPSEVLQSTHSEVFVCSLEELNEEISRNSRNHCIFLGVYTVDTTEELNYALSCGVNAIGTNFPERIIAELKMLGRL